MSYYYTLPDGRQMSQEEFNDYRTKKIDAEIAAERQAQDEAARLVAELSEAYKACARIYEGAIRNWSARWAGRKRRSMIFI